MKKILLLVAFAVVLLSSCAFNKSTAANDSKFYDYSALNIRGEEVKMSDLQGKVVLVVNTASKCGFTPQFAGLEELYKKYQEVGLVILGFPSNQFGNQDPGTNEEIHEFCQTNYGVTFPMFSKIEVNGENEHPLYTYLKSSVPDTEAADISWNFTKFLIGKEGKTIGRYAPKVEPDKLENDIRLALQIGD